MGGEKGHANSMRQLWFFSLEFRRGVADLGICGPRQSVAAARLPVNRQPSYPPNIGLLSLAQERVGPLSSQRYSGGWKA